MGQPNRVGEVRWGARATASLKVSRRFGNGGNGQAGTAWQLSGRPESVGQSCGRPCTRLVSALLPLPRSPGCRRRPRRGPGEVRVGAWGRGPGGDGSVGQERPPPHPRSSPHPDSLLGRKSRNAGCRRAAWACAPDSTAPGAAPPGRGAGAAGPAARTRPGLLHLNCLSQIKQGFSILPHFPVQGSSLRSCPGATPRAGLQLPHPSRGALLFRTETETQYPLGLACWLS